MPWQPPDIDDRDAARLLGVDVDSDAAAVRAAFRELAKRAHPDRAGGQPALDIGRLVDARNRLLARAHDPLVARTHDRSRSERAPHHSVARARRKTPFDDQIIDLTVPVGHLVDVTG